MPDFSTKKKENQAKTQGKEGLQEEENGNVYMRTMLEVQSLIEWNLIYLENVVRAIKISESLCSVASNKTEESEITAIGHKKLKFYKWQSGKNNKTVSERYLLLKVSRNKSAEETLSK